MLDSIWQTLVSEFQNNQFLTGATLTGVLVGLTAWARSLIMRSIAFVRRFFTISLTVHSEDALYLYISRWLYQHGFDRFSRAYRLRYLDGDPVYGPTVGTFSFIHQRRLVKVTLTTEQTPQGGSSWRAQTREFMTITYLSARRSRDLLERIVAEAIEQARKLDETGTPIYVSNGGGWFEVTRVKRRNKPCVVLAEGVLEALEADVQKWLGRQEWYLDRGVPYRRGYLLTGPPGTGKTSIVRHLAQRFGIPVYISDGSMRSISSVPHGSILLLEDVDSISRMRQSAEQLRGMSPAGGPVDPTSNAPVASSGAGDTERIFAPTLSELLNALDGLASIEKVIVVMTTNHPEKLDHAMIRPGRVDYRLHVGKCTSEQAVRLFDKFYQPTAGDLAAFGRYIEDDALTPAELQNIFMRSATPAEAITAVVFAQHGRLALVSEAG